VSASGRRRRRRVAASGPSLLPPALPVVAAHLHALGLQARVLCLLKRALLGRLLFFQLAAGLGLASVHRRIQAYYGDEGRLRIASAPVLGTSISILVPIEPPAHVEVAA
jgi:hypothetical protein